MVAALVSGFFVASPALAATATDGEGTMDVSPASVSAGAIQSFTFTFTATPGSFNNGSAVTLVIPASWSSPQKTTSGNAGYVTIVSSTCAANKPHTGTTDVGISGNTITISAMSCNNTKSFVLAYNNAVAATTSGPYAFTSNSDEAPLSGNGVALAVQPVVTVMPGALSNVTVSPSGPQTVNQGGTLQFSTQGFDAFGNSVSITPTWSVVSGTGTGSIDSSGLFTAGNAGTVTVRAASNAITGDSGTITIPKQDQTITFGALADKTYGDSDFTISANASSGLPVTFSVTGNCSIIDSTINITLVGNCTVTAHQVGDGNYNQAPDVPQSFNITPKNLDVTANGQSKTVGQNFTFTGAEFLATGLVSGDSVTSVTLTSDGAGAEAAIGTYPIVPSDAVGTGLNNYSISYHAGTFTVNDKLMPSITWPTPADITYLTALDATQLNASADVPGTFTYTPVAGTVLNGGDNILHVDFVPDNTAAYNNASKDVHVNVTKKDQNITFGELSVKTFGDADFTVSATVDSGLAVSFTSSGNCTVSGDTVHVTAPGSCTVTAKQSGNNNYNAATDVPQSFAINAAANTNGIDFESPTYVAGLINGQDGWTATGSAGSGCAIYDEGVVSNITAPATFSAQSFRISDAVTSGCFGDQAFAKPLTGAVGETDATFGAFTPTAKQSHFEMQFDIASAIPDAQQPGMHTSVSPDRGDGSRMSYLRFEDGVNGINVFFDDVQGTTNPANFVETQVETDLNRALPHTIKLTMDVIDGPSNDVVKVWIDGTLVHTGTSWENYYRYDSESAAEQSPRVVKTVLFRESGAANAADFGHGFLFDNLSFSSGSVAVSGITLNKSTNTIEVGSTDTLIATVAPANATNKNMNWSSDTTSVATVNSSGVVTAVAPGTATITATTIDGNFSATSVVTVPASLTLSLSENSGTISGAKEFSTVSSGVTVTVNIPDGTTVTGDSSWNGVVSFPIATSTFTLTPDSGNTATAVEAIAIGAGDTPLILNNAARLLFAGQTGKLVGWSRGGVFTQITNVCSADSQAVGDALPAGGDCKFDNNTDLVVWTKHFTSFVTYTQTANPTPVPSSGGGGGGGPIGTFINGPLANQNPTSTTPGRVLGTAIAIGDPANLGKYNLKEGDTVSAAVSNDPDVYIVNAFGYKRLFLNPIIFNFYGHLGWNKVKKVTAEAKSVLPTSGLFRNCETNDQRVYGVETTGEDTGKLHWVNTSGAQAVADDPNFFKKVFCINSNEFNWYQKGSDYTSVDQIPVYNRQ